MGTAGTPNGVRRQRERRRWTLKQLETLTGIAEAHLSKIERGLVNPNGITQERLADALGVDRDLLFPEPQEATA